MLEMTSENNDNKNDLHRLSGTDEQQEGGLIVKKKSQAVSSNDQYVFKVPQTPSSFGLDKLAAEKRRSESSINSSKRSKTSSFNRIDNENIYHDKNQSRHLRETRIETPSSSRSSHHDFYDKSRSAPKNLQRGLAYGKNGNKEQCKFILFQRNLVFLFFFFLLFLNIHFIGF